jgi:hypothetical protein
MTALGIRAVQTRLCTAISSVQERVDVRVCRAFYALRQQPLEVELVSTMRDCTAIPSASDPSC